MSASFSSQKHSPQGAQSNKLTPSSKSRKRKDGGVSSDEERWLDALESGKLEEMDDELKKIKPKDPKLMTARQRAMYERGSDKEQQSNVTSVETLMALPSGYKEKVMTAEAIQKAALKSQKRKQQADEKREKDKKKTMERILKKQESKTQKNSNIMNNIRQTRNTIPSVSLLQTQEMTLLSFPHDTLCPLREQLIEKPMQKVYCAMNCGRLKKYSCSKTGQPLCSLKCYKKNLSSRFL